VILAERPPRRRHERRRLVWRAGLLALALTLAFFVGIAFARALDQHPRPDGIVTSIRTLAPVAQRPAGKTVTVTVTAP
jgi:ABC-type Zn uptake system ZnuABC Zn-binding protein ZnuA